jgi:hypothetical protein
MSGTRDTLRFATIVLFGLAWSACDLGTFRGSDTVTITHDPVIATSSETVTFTATADTESEDYRIRMFVNETLVQTCYNMSTCIYTGGPFPTYEGTTVSFLAALDTFDCDHLCDKVDGYYNFGITDSSYNYGSLTYIPAKVSVGTTERPSGNDTTLLFHMANDYVPNGQTFADFLDDVQDKIYDVYGAKDIIRAHMDDMDAYVYTRQAGTGSCGTVAWQTNTEVPWRDNDAILHYLTMNDCTDSGLTHFTAEGSYSVDFLHHSGHAVFGLADEGAGATGYFQSTHEPNIWSSEAGCRSEQSAKRRDPNDCAEFEPGWWGIHSGTTVMSNGELTDPWGIEAAERIGWFYSTL